MLYFWRQNFRHEAFSFSLVSDICHLVSGSAIVPFFFSNSLVSTLSAVLFYFSLFDLFLFLILVLILRCRRKVVDSCCYMRIAAFGVETIVVSAEDFRNRLPHRHRHFRCFGVHFRLTFVISKRYDLLIRRVDLVPFTAWRFQSYSVHFKAFVSFLCWFLCRYRLNKWITMIS